MKDVSDYRITTIEENNPTMGYFCYLKHRNGSDILGRLDPQFKITARKLTDHLDVIAYSTDYGKIRVIGLSSNETGHTRSLLMQNLPDGTAVISFVDDTYCKKAELGDEAAMVSVYPIKSDGRFGERIDFGYIKCCSWYILQNFVRRHDEYCLVAYEGDRSVHHLQTIYVKCSTPVE